MCAAHGKQRQKSQAQTCAQERQACGPFLENVAPKRAEEKTDTDGYRKTNRKPHGGYEQCQQNISEVSFEDIIVAAVSWFEKQSWDKYCQNSVGIYLLD